MKEDLIVRCSRLGAIMTDARSKAEPLSETAKAYIKEVAYCEFFGIEKDVFTKEISKGIQCEQDSIDLLNLVEFENYSKSTESENNGWLTGHPDILTDTSVIDIKTSWSFDTFPMLQEDADKIVATAKYEWQVRGYMMLFEKESAKVAFCLVDTPDELLSDWDNELIHKVSHIAPQKRITYSQTFTRCLEIEKKIKERYDLANAYYRKIIFELKNK